MTAKRAAPRQPVRRQQTRQRYAPHDQRTHDTPPPNDCQLSPGATRPGHSGTSTKRTASRQPVSRQHTRHCAALPYNQQNTQPAPATIARTHNTRSSTASKQTLAPSLSSAEARSRCAPSNTMRPPTKRTGLRSSTTQSSLPSNAKYAHLFLDP